MEKTARALSEFRETYDKSLIIPARVRKALTRMGKGRWAYESEFAKLAEVTLADLGNFRDKFSAYVVQLREGRRAWAGTPGTAVQMRNSL
jgi:hypothetical protein